MPFLAELPEDTKQMLRTVSSLDWEGVDVQVQPLSGLTARVPQSRIWAGLIYVTGSMRGLRQIRSSLRAVGATIGQTIFIDPSFAKWNTAAGLALLVHERRHVEQKRTIPGFDDLYIEAQANVHPDRPWENPYEMDAYQEECRAYYDLLAKGVPPGNWVPLGVAMGFCG